MEAPPETYQHIGERIRSVRVEEGLSQEQLAHLIHRRQATISGWETGKRLPSLDDLYDVAFVLDRSIHDFLPQRRLEPPLRGLLRAIAEQFPAGPRVRASLELFLKNIAAMPPPERELKVEASDPQALAADLLRASRTKAPPVDVIGMARRCGARVVGWGGMDESISGILVQLEDGPAISFNTNHPIGRQRFTVAHELGHLLLGHLKEFHVDLSAPLDSEERPGYNRRQEKAANSFAANLLMPEAWVRKRVGAEPLEVLAEKTFEVSELALGYRLMNLGLAEPGSNG